LLRILEISNFFWRVTSLVFRRIGARRLFPFRAMTEIRRELTRKYNLKFLAAADRLSSSYRRPILEPAARDREATARRARAE
jgi:hypothetical protein